MPIATVIGASGSLDLTDAANDSGAAEAISSIPSARGCITASALSSCADSLTSAANSITSARLAS